MTEYVSRLLSRLSDTWKQYENGQVSEEALLGMISATSSAMDGSVPQSLRDALQECERGVELAYALLSADERKKEIARLMRQVLQNN